MKLIKPSYEILKQDWNQHGIYKQIEMSGRTCYKSEDKITEDSAKEFVDRIIKSGHGAMLEHGTVYLTIPCFKDDSTNDVALHYINNKYSVIKDNYGTIKNIHDFDRKAYVTTNLRVLIENGWLDDLQYLCKPTKYHEIRITVKFICDRGVSHEFVRHRVFSFAQESTRYCNYSKDKFGNELTFIIPCWLNISEGQYTYWDGDWCDIDKMKIQFPEGKHKDIDAFLWTLNNAQLHYNLLINSGWKPQQARAILPNALKTELVMTGFVSDWKHFFELRTPINAHPQARELAMPLLNEFIEKGYLNGK